MAGAIAAALTTFLEGAPKQGDSSFLVVVFANTFVVAIVRVAIVFAAGYVIASVVGLVVAGRWLVRLGQFEVSEASVRANQEIADSEMALIRDELEFLKAEYRTALAEIHPSSTGTAAPGTIDANERGEDE